MATSSDNQSSEIAVAGAGQKDEEAIAAQPPKSRMKQVEEYFRYDPERDKASDVRTALLTVAVLIVTATYQAGLSPPGGVWSENNDKVHPKQVAGKSIMGTNDQGSFGVFMVGNSLGFYFSLYMIGFLTSGFPLQLELVITMAAMTITYCSAMITISPTVSLSSAFNFLSILLPISLPFIIRFLRNSKLAAKMRERFS